jgi:WD40 repeat protein
VFEGHTDMVTTLALLADNRPLSGSMDETVRLWDLATGTSRVLDKHRYFSTHRVSVLAALPDGRVLFGNGEDLQVSDLAGGETLKLENLRGMHRAIAALPDGRVLLGSWDRTVQLWDIVSGTGRNLEGSMEWNGVVALLPDGHALLVGSRDRSLCLWDLNPGRSTYGTQLAGFEGDGGFSCLAVLPDGRGVVAGDVLGYIHWLEIVE